MKASLPTADVRDYARHIAHVDLPDPDDRHVVAAAITAEASVIVTWNVTDFPQAELARYGLRREDPDTFLLNLYETAPEVVVAVAANARRNLRQSLPSSVEFVETLERQRLKGFAGALRSGLLASARPEAPEERS